VYADLPPHTGNVARPDEIHVADDTGLPVVVPGRPRMVRYIAPVTVEHFRDLGAISDEWAALAAANTNVFASWEWNEIWWRHFGRGDLDVLGLRSAGGRLRAIIPLYRRTIPPLRLSRLLGHGPADQAPLVYAAADVGAPLDLLWAARTNATRADVLLLEQLGETAAYSKLVGTTALARQPAPYVRFGYAGWDAFLASLAKRTRESIRRKERQLYRRRTVVVRLTDAATLEGDLDVLFALHERRWPESSFGTRQSFHREFASAALQRGWLRLWILEADGVPAAAWYGFRFGDVEHFYQSGWDPDFAADSVGQVLLVHTMRAAYEDGVATYRFGRGGEAYKSRYAKEVDVLTTFAWPRTALGKGATAAAPLVQRLRHVLRSRRT
jgi:CelD/BcsL family acetyltransferase involved in cellulose biosynthesis